MWHAGRGVICWAGAAAGDLQGRASACTPPVTLADTGQNVFRSLHPSSFCVSQPSFDSGSNFLLRLSPCPCCVSVLNAADKDFVQKLADVAGSMNDFKQLIVGHIVGRRYHH